MAQATKFSKLLQECLCLSGFRDIIIVTVLQVCTKDLSVKFILTAFNIHYNFHYGIE